MNTASSLKQGAVLLEFGGACAGDLGQLVESRPCEADLVGAVVDVEARLHGPEGDLTMAVGSNNQARRAAEVEVIAVPEIRLDEAAIVR